MSRIHIYGLGVLLCISYISFGQDSSTYSIIDTITLHGNKHTKRDIILRELLFHQKDTVFMGKEFEKQIEASRQHVLNTSLFNFVDISLFRENGRLTIDVHVIERWSLWPNPYFNLADRNIYEWWENKNLDRASMGLDLVKYNFRGRRETIRAKVVFGYEEEYSIAYSKPYINAKKTWGIGAQAGYKGIHEIPYKVQENRLSYFKDPSNYAKAFYFNKVDVQYRKNIHTTHTFQWQYNRVLLADTLSKLNPDFAINGEMSKSYMAFYYQFKHDYRDMKAYPLTGYYLDVECTKTTVDKPYIQLKSTGRKYIKVMDKVHFATGYIGFISTYTQSPFFLMQGIGFKNDIVRGYEKNVVMAPRWGIIKSNIKYTLIAPHTYHIKFISTEKFSKTHYAVYLNLFNDIGYASKFLSSEINPLNNTLLVGNGIGLDVVTYYDKVFRFEYAVNKSMRGSFFIHFVAPI